jgi:class 3 adenylate cyclase
VSERRPRTFLFTDLVGFTTLTELEGDDRGADVAQAFCGSVRSLLPAHGGAEVKSLGDGLMIVCEDASQALRLGVAIIEPLEAAPGFPAVRVGIHTGPAVQRDGDWYGTTVNVAARLCSAAGGGEVLASEATCAAAGRIRKLELDEPRLHWLKNLTEPVSARPVARSHCPGARAAALKSRMGRRVRRGVLPARRLADA